MSKKQQDKILIQDVKRIWPPREVFIAKAWSLSTLISILAQFLTTSLSLRLILQLFWNKLKKEYSFWENKSLFQKVQLSWVGFMWLSLLTLLCLKKKKNSLHRVFKIIGVNRSKKKLKWFSLYQNMFSKINSHCCLQDCKTNLYANSFIPTFIRLSNSMLAGVF